MLGPSGTTSIYQEVQGRSIQHLVHRARLSIQLMKRLNDKRSALKCAVREFQRQSQKTKHWSSTNVQGPSCPCGWQWWGARACMVCAQLVLGCGLTLWEQLSEDAHPGSTVKLRKVLICNSFVQIKLSAHLEEEIQLPISPKKKGIIPIEIKNHRYYNVWK